MKYFERKFLVRLAAGKLSEKEHHQFKLWLFGENSDIQELWLEAFAKIHASKGKNIYLLPDEIQRKKQNTLLAAAAVFLFLFSFTAFLFFANNKQHIRQYISADEPNEVVLADNTKISLDRNSSINVLYTKNERQIELKGEALFHVNEDKDRPMIVKTEVVKTTVTGTIFKIKQSENGIQVFLKEGGIDVTHNSTTKSLKPNQQWIWNRSNGKEILLNYTQDTPWSNIRFENQPLSNVLSFLEWRYDVTFENEAKQLSGCLISISIEDVALEKVLQLISYISNVVFETNNNKQFRISENCK